MYSSNQNEFQKPATSYGQPATGFPTAPPTAYPYQANNQPPAHFHTTTPGNWSSGLCDCFSDFSTCCVTCWCPCITFGQIAEVVDKGTTSCAVAGGLYTLLTLLTCCGCMYSCIYRSKLRKQYNLPENPCNDFLVHCCCESCSLCQEYRELKHRGYDMSIGWQGNMERQNGGITMAPAYEGGMSRY